MTKDNRLKTIHMTSMMDALEQAIKRTPANSQKMGEYLDALNWLRKRMQKRENFAKLVAEVRQEVHDEARQRWLDSQKPKK